MLSDSTAIGVGHTALRLRGRDALTVIQRISSQQLETLERGHARTTLFCDFRGRLLHRAAVVRASDDALWLLRDDAPGAELAAHVDRHVFREDVTIEDLSPQWTARAEWRNDDVSSIEEHDGIPVVVPEGRGFHLLLVPAAQARALDPARFERDRITRGRPRHGHEIHEDFNPYEIGCGDEVHLSKGCYTGQEALQRLITYASVRRQPVLVRGRGEAPLVPADLVSTSGVAGRLTSTTAGDVAGTWLGFAVVRNEALLASTGGTVPPFAIEGGPGIDSFQPFPERHPLGRP
jgi:tRNA-modifying protein YgfZ